MHESNIGQLQGGYVPVLVGACFIVQALKLSISHNLQLLNRSPSWTKPPKHKSPLY